jgi:hypothetical protein
MRAYAVRLLRLRRIEFSVHTGSFAPEKASTGNCCFALRAFAFRNAKRALIIFSIFCFGAAVWRMKNSGAARPYPDVPRIDARILIAMSVFLSIVSLAALFGIWFV